MKFVYLLSLHALRDIRNSLPIHQPHKSHTYSEYELTLHQKFLRQKIYTLDYIMRDDMKTLTTINRDLYGTVNKMK